MNQQLNMMQMIQSFPGFMHSMRGQNPDQIINNMIQTGRINQQQVEQAKQQAQTIMGQMNQFKSMFGFR